MSYSPIERMDTKLSGASQSSTVYPDQFRRISSRWWFWEIASITITLLAFFAIIITLRVFDGKPLPEIPFGITLNTIASLLGTAVKTTLLLVVSSALSQLKWLWFHQKERGLQDLQVYDEASRGPWGAMVLLRTSKFSFASLGALIVLFLLGFDPFIQQLITTPQRTILTSEKSTAIVRATAFNQSALFQIYRDVSGGTSARLTGKNPSSGITLAVANGVNSQISLPELTPVCPSSNCTWPVFSTLSLCSTCTNVTDYARQNWQCQQTTNETRTCNYKLPSSEFNYTYSGLTFNNSKATNYAAGEELRHRIWTQRLDHSTSPDNAFQRVNRIIMEDGDKLIPGPAREQVREATECTFSMCVLQHKVSVQDGISLVSRLGSISNPFRTTSIIMNNISGVTSYAVSPAIILGQEYTIDGPDTLYALAYAIETTLPGNITAEYTYTINAEGKEETDGGVSPTSQLNMFFYTELDFTAAMENIATSVSTYMRSLSNDTVIGESQSLERYIRVQWAWISFSAVLVLGGFLLLLFAMMETSKRGVEVWKYSCLPLLFHSVGGGDGRGVSEVAKRGLATVQEMEEEAKRIRVRLGRDEDNGGWVLQRERRDREMR